MKQTAAQKRLINIFQDYFGLTKVRIIKIHGSKYQEAGLPDTMVMAKTKYGRPHFWIEIKRDWKDKPTSLQDFNITELKGFGFCTGYFIGDEFKEKWDDVPVKLGEYLRKNF